MRYRFSSLLIIMAVLLWSSCEELPEPTLENPLDTIPVDPGDTTTLATPALVFFPEEGTVSLGSGITVEPFIVGISQLSGAYLRINYDKNRLEILSIAAGEVFADGQADLFLYEINSGTGVIELWTSYLSDGQTISVSGSSSFASINFRSLSAGDALLLFDVSTCDLRDPNDQPLEIARFEEGVIHVQ